LATVEHLLEQTVQSDDNSGFSAGQAKRAFDTPSTAEFTPIRNGMTQRVGRYELFELLGQGASGRVYCGYDLELQRQVAVKVPPPERFRTSSDSEAFLYEARMVAVLDHPHIAQVYDAGRTADGRVYVVSKLIQGCNLNEWSKTRQLTFDEISQLMATAADALHHAHQRHIIHRDVKPSNLMVDEVTHALYVVDFGLAVNEEAILHKRRPAVGTPSYMSPEQVLGEGHRLDGRSDVFSLGIVLYQLLTGKRPFTGATSNEILHQVITLYPPTPRDLVPAVPLELNRICMKAIAKRIAERYRSAAEMADDLRNWQLLESRNYAATVASPIVIPRGLRSYGADDSDFFLELLPGPRDRHGMPESIAFWKRRIEETRPEETFSVGIIYGPSGCGKSSLVKAGLLPCLSEEVVVVYVEATGEETESRIVYGLEKAFPGMSSQGDLAETLMRLRQHGKCKTLVIIDQFEQWLNFHRADSESLLVRALRQCEGGRVQAILLIRDDFGMAASRFMEVLEIPILQGHNFATVDMFDTDHAKKVLRRFGHAYGRVPDPSQPLSEHQSEFIESVVKGLAHDGRVISIQLSILAEMVKGRDWTPATLVELGSTAGIGVRFLEDTFSSRAANPRHARYELASRKVLMALLPSVGSDIKGHMRSYGELHEASEIESYSGFDELLRMLDGELRLITPTDPDGARSQSASDHELKYYQLTHDFLVPSLREWLTLKQRESRSGRATLKLIELTALWTPHPESRNLPSLAEYASILWHVPRQTQTEGQKSMLKAAGYTLGLRWGLGLLTLIAVLFAANYFVSTQRAIVAKNKADNDLQQARVMVDWVTAGPADALPYILPNLKPLQDYATPILNRSLANTGSEPLKHLRSALALESLHGGQSEVLVASIDTAPAEECRNLVQGLRRDQQHSLRLIRQQAETMKHDQNWRSLSRMAIVSAHLGNFSLARDMLIERADPIQRTVLIDTAAQWNGDWNDWLVSREVEEDRAFRHFICLAIGGMNDQSKKANLDTLLAKVSDWYQHDPDAATHSASQWCLRRSNRPLPNSESISTNEREWYVNSIGLTMIAVPAGEFKRSDQGNDLDQTIILTRGFWLSECEITRSQFLQFINDEHYPKQRRPTTWKEASLIQGLSHPARWVSWRDAALFCNWLSDREGYTLAFDTDTMQFIPGSNGYRLTSEAEWEYACRAGSATPFHFGQAEEFLAGYDVVTENQTQPVGTRMPNGLGLFDMHGNLLEWCLDQYLSRFPAEERLNDPLHDPQSKPNDPKLRRAIRGGSHAYDSTYSRADSRNHNLETYRSHTIGFRVARNAKD
jgi:serine/threonine protein kinase/formylglycine-generating enzyme required for sulfatase activity